MKTAHELHHRERKGHRESARENIFWGGKPTAEAQSGSRRKAGRRKNSTCSPSSFALSAFSVVNFPAVVGRSFGERGIPRGFRQIPKEFLQPAAAGGSLQVGFAAAGQKKGVRFFEMHQAPRNSGTCGGHAAGIVSFQASRPILGAPHVRALAGRAV